MAREEDGKIFISYRRSDAQGVAGRLNDSLGAYFGHDRVFRDIEDIVGGADFGDVIHGSLGSADALLVLIGPDWATTTNGEGQRRLMDPDDWVAAEIGATLEAGTPVFPVLIEDTPMPRSEDLPPRLQPLLRHNAVTITDLRWQDDITRLAKIVALDIPGSVAERRLDLVRWLVLAMMLAAAILTTVLVALNGRELVADYVRLSGDDNVAAIDRLIPAAAAAVNYVAIVASAVLMLIVAPQVDTRQRRWHVTGAAVGLTGAFVGLVAYWLFDRTWETPMLFLISNVTLVLVLAFAVLSGFKPK